MTRKKTGESKETSACEWSFQEGRVQGARADQETRSLLSRENESQDGVEEKKRGRRALKPKRERDGRPLRLGGGGED